jgi:hypothetical protein
MHVCVHDAKAALDGGNLDVGGANHTWRLVWHVRPPVSNLDAEYIVELQGKEADLGVSSPFIGPDAPDPESDVYNDAQMHDMAKNEDKSRPQALAQVHGGWGQRLSGKAAVEAAATHPGGMLHGDDAYVQVRTGQVLTSQERLRAARRDERKLVRQQLRPLASSGVFACSVYSAFVRMRDACNSSCTSW